MSHVHHLEADARERLLARLSTVLTERRDVSFACVFGSFLDQETFRDVDVGVWTADLADGRVDLELATDLSQQLGLPVDVRRLNDAPVPFLFHALQGRLVAVRDQELLANLMERTAWEYHDRAPLLRRALREAFAG